VSQIFDAYFRGRINFGDLAQFFRDSEQRVAIFWRFQPEHFREFSLDLPARQLSLVEPRKL